MPFEQKEGTTSSDSSLSSSSSSLSSSSSSSSSSTGDTSSGSSSSESSNSDNSTDFDSKNSTMVKKSARNKKTSEANVEKLLATRNTAVNEKVSENNKSVANNKVLTTNKSDPNKNVSTENDKKVPVKNTDCNRKSPIKSTKNIQRTMPVIKAEIYSDSSDSDSENPPMINTATVKVEKDELQAPKLTQQRNLRKNSKSVEDNISKEEQRNDKSNVKFTGTVSKNRCSRSKSYTPSPPKLTPIKNVNNIITSNESKPSILSRGSSWSSSSDSSCYSPPRSDSENNERSVTENVATRRRCKCKYDYKNKRKSESPCDSSCDSKCDSNCRQPLQNYDEKVKSIDNKVQAKKDPEMKTIATVNDKVAHRARGRPRKHSSPPKETSQKDNIFPSDKIVTRKQARSTISNITRVRKLLSVTGNTSDSDSSIGVGGKSATNVYGLKKIKPVFPKMSKNGKDNVLSHHSRLLLEERRERCCPVEGCDSSGHLNGIFEKHFSPNACPLFHNLTPKLCQEYAVDRQNRQDERQKIMLTTSKFERKAYRDKIKMQGLSIYNLPTSITSDDVSDATNNEREPDFSKCNMASHHIKLFRDAQAATSEIIEEELKLLPNVRGTKYIEIGSHQVEVWYQSPYPDEFTDVPKLYICEYCLGYMKTRARYDRHRYKCVWRYPPGEEVYRKDNISVWEVDGRKYKTYSQNLCLLAKFFLDHKTLYYDVEPFLFYIMTINDDRGCHIVGYFSKEKNSFLNFNVSCILTLPPYQRQGYGRLLIDFSYLLTRVEGKIGSPEKPLSDLGLISYRSYWKDILLDRLCQADGSQVSIKDLSTDLGINSYDIVSTLQVLGIMKYWKGKHIIIKNKEIIEEHREKIKRRPPNYKVIDSKCLRWHPPAIVKPPNNLS